MNLTFLLTFTPPISFFSYLNHNKLLPDPCFKTEALADDKSL